MTAMLKLTQANSEARPIWFNPTHIAAVLKGQVIKGDAVIILKDGSRFDVAETAKNVVDAMAQLP